MLIKDFETQHKKELDALHEQGMFYYGIKKNFQGNVDKSKFFNVPGLIINTFGYYQNSNDTWIVFITDDERGIEVKRKKFCSEEECIKYLIELSENQNFIYYSNTIINDFNTKKDVLVEYLKKEYNYSDIKAQKAVEYLLQVPLVAFEFWYYIEHDDFVPDKYCYKIQGYSAKQLYNTTYLNVLGAFNYLVYLKTNPTEASENLKKGLPRK